MNLTRWALISFTLVLTGCVTTYTSHEVRICDSSYTFTGSIKPKRHHVLLYRVTVEGHGRPARMLELGRISNEYDRATIMAALKDSLHKADLFPPCAGQSGENDRRLDVLIRQLTADPFPFSHDIIAATEIIDDNNLLKLLQQSVTGQYQLVNETNTGSTTFLHYDNSDYSYRVDWDNLKGDNSRFIREHFDAWLRLYFRMLLTTVKPELFLLFNTADTTIAELVYRYPEKGPEPTKSGVILQKAVAEKISNPDNRIVRIAGAGEVNVKPVADPFHPIKKPKKDAPDPYEHP